VGEDCIESRISRLVSDKRAPLTGPFDGESDTVRFDPEPPSMVRKGTEPEGPALTT